MTVGVPVHPANCLVRRSWLVVPGSVLRLPPAASTTPPPVVHTLWIRALVVPPRPDPVITLVVLTTSLVESAD